MPTKLQSQSMLMSQQTNIIALDVGDKRIGVARASHLARIPESLDSIENTDVVWQKLQKIMTDYNANAIVVGLPRNLDGNETQQTTKVRKFASNLQKKINLPIYLQDEALTSSMARTKLKSLKQKFTKGAVDSEAAAIILEDFLDTN